MAINRREERDQSLMPTALFLRELGGLTAIGQFICPSGGIGYRVPGPTERPGYFFFFLSWFNSALSLSRSAVTESICSCACLAF